MKLKQIFKERVTRKLAIYSFIILIIFSMIVVSIFTIFFERYIESNEYSVSKYKDIVVNTARRIANDIQLKNFNDETNADNKNSKPITPNYGFFEFGFIRSFTLKESNFWLVDQDRKIRDYKDSELDNFNFNWHLTSHERDLINLAFGGREIVFNNISHFTKEMFITVGIPIYGDNGQSGATKEMKEPVAVLMAQSIFERNEQVLLKGFLFIFISLTIAFIISYILFIVFSHRFTRSLYKMRDNAFELSKGNYDVKNNIFQDDEIGYLANTLDFLSVKLKEADEQTKNLEKLRNDFISNISHELRTPATVMMGSLEALVDGVVTNEEDVKEYHISMLNEAKFLSRLIGDLLEISRLQNLDFVIEKSELSILDVINDVIRSIKRIETKKNILIKFHKDEFKNEIYGDYGRLKQMFMIILDNSVKFSNENSEVEIKLSGNQIRIKDYGSGIRKEDIPYIFDRFYKERSEKNKVGTGLGLSIAKNIAIRHDITLKVESEFGKYTEFIFEY